MIEPREQPVFFPADSEMLFGMLTHPVTEPHGTCLVVMQGGGYNVSSRPNRSTRVLAVEAAKLGYHTFRFSYHGVENSTGQMEEVKLDEPFTADAMAAVDFLRGAGLRRLVLMGSCFGARTALAVAPHVPELRGLILEAPSTRDHGRSETGAARIAEELGGWEYLKRTVSTFKPADVADRERRRQYLRFVVTKLRVVARGIRRRAGVPAYEDRHGASRSFLEPVRHLHARRVPMLFVYGTTDWFGTEFARARDGTLGRMIRSPDSAIEAVEIPGNVHGLTTIETQSRVRSIISDWLARHAPVVTSNPGLGGTLEVTHSPGLEDRRRP